ncbi:MAG: hypothetical protein F6K54_24920, partial [Okeania sp. SIO3B5]|uniref:hypothetical protein n=1 Tax=Okeania sp. SIO3B5 TaxID=2607811 RepID=UPI0014011E43
MTTAVSNTLLALLLALKNLENPLSEEEHEALTDLGKQLKRNPNDWNLNKQKLMAILKANDTLKQLYQKAKAKLDALDRPIPPDLLPIDADLKELKDVLPPESEANKRAHIPGKPD